MEEVVHANGQVRPIENISIIKNITPGEIIKINYKPGQKVNKNDVLLKIDNTVHNAHKNALQVRYEETNKQINGVKLLIKSYYENKNLIPQTHTSAFARFKVYINEKEILSKRLNMVKTLWIEAMQLPPSAVQPVKLRDMKYQTDMAELDLTTYNNKFINNLIIELDNLLIEKERIYGQLKEISSLLKNTVLISPISGYVQEISSLNEGDYIAQGQAVLNIVPDETKEYKIELSVPTKDAGKITQNMKIKYRFKAFPYHEFGGAEGTIISIDPDSYIAKDGNVYFAILGDIDKTVLFDKEKKEYTIKPGFEVNARIILKEQTILWHFLKTMDLVW